MTRGHWSQARIPGGFLPLDNENGKGFPFFVLLNPEPLVGSEGNPMNTAPPVSNRRALKAEEAGKFLARLLGLQIPISKQRI